MKEIIKELYSKYKHFIFYGIFGVLTTLVNIAVYYICSHICHLNTVPSTIIAWFVAVLFAYITNRKWVFVSSVDSAKGLINEMAMFYLFRALTGVLDVVFMFVTVDLFGWHDVLMKVLSNIIVIILNYVFSRWIIFKRKEND